MEAAGAKLPYLWPHSPDFNPIEHCRPLVKQPLRQLKARSLDALGLAIPQALSLTLSGDCQDLLQTLRLCLMRLLQNSGNRLPNGRGSEGLC